MTRFFLILMIVFAVLAVRTRKLRRAVIHMGVFSLISSFAYLLYSAPDVAIAEAVIGSTLATILYLVALQKYKVFTIYYTNEDAAGINDKYISKGRGYILNMIEKFCISRELEPQVIYTTESLEQIISEHQYDLIVRQRDNRASIYGHKENYQLDSLQEYIYTKGDQNIDFHCVIQKIEEED